MRQENILLPLFLLVLFTFGVGIRMLEMRIKAVREDGLNPGYFKLNRGGKVPEYLDKVTRHYANLFELPVLFYVVSLMLYVTQKVDMVFMALAWLFVVTRYIHGYIHITYNDLRHRRMAFLAGTVLVFCIWARLFVSLFIL